MSAGVVVTRKITITAPHQYCTLIEPDHGTVSAASANTTVTPIHLRVASAKATAIKMAIAQMDFDVFNATITKLCLVVDTLRSK